MGTRSLICVVYCGKFVVAQYTQYDGYLGGQGAKIIKFLLVPGNIERLRKGLAHIFTPTAEYMEEIERQVEAEEERRRNCGEYSYASELQAVCPSLAADTGAKILEVIASASEETKVPIQMELEFASDGLYCEYAYVVDLDYKVFECYGGSRYSHKDAGSRFLGVTVPGFLTEFSFEQVALMNNEKDFLAVVEDEEMR